PNIAERSARLSLILPIEGAELAAAGNLADQAAAAMYADRGLADRELTKAMAEFRRGRFAEAGRWADQAAVTGARRTLPAWSHERQRNRDSTCQLLLAMIHHQQQRPSESASALAEGERILRTAG